ncbi:hypothetical protein CCP3SC15_1100004 [Gammaproteobacteria bacterium]
MEIAQGAPHHGRVPPQEADECGIRSAANQSSTYNAQRVGKLFEKSGMESDATVGQGLSTGK